MSYQVHFDSSSVIARRHGLSRGGVIQKFIDSEAIRLSAPYTPFDTSQLVKSATLGTVIGSGEISYNSPYAKYLYYGKVMVSPTTGSAWAGMGERKILNGDDIAYNGAPKRGARWFERMKQNHGRPLLREVERLGNINR